MAGSILIQHALLAFILLSNLLFTGLVFGWASLQLTLEEENQFQHLCHDSKLPSGETCADQRKAFNLIYVVGATAVAFCPLPGGFMLDRFGPRRYGLLVGILMILGLCLMAFADSTSFNTFAASFALMGGAGVANFGVSLPITFVYPPEQQPLIHAVMNCLFDASACVFLIFEQLYFHYDVSRRDFFLSLAAIAVLVYVTIFVLWTWIEPVFMRLKGTEMEPLVPSPSLASVDLGLTQDEENLLSAIEGDAQALQDQPLSRQLKSAPFLLHTLVVCIQLFRFNVFMSINRDLLKDYGDDDTYIRIYSILLPSAFVLAPIISFVINRGGYNFTMMLTAFLGLAYGVLACIRSLPLQVVTAICFVSFRVFLYSVNSSYLACVFGPRSIGKLLGGLFVVAGFVNLLQYPAVSWSNDADTFFPLNVVMATAGGLILPIVLKLRLWEKSHIHVLSSVADRLYPSNSFRYKT